MPTVTFESSDGAIKKTVEAPNGGALADLCDDHEAPIPFSCRSASCATCHIEVLEGPDTLLPPEDEELDVLEAIEADVRAAQGLELGPEHLALPAAKPSLIQAIA